MMMICQTHTRIQTQPTTLNQKKIEQIIQRNPEKNQNIPGECLISLYRFFLLYFFVFTVDYIYGKHKREKEKNLSFVLVLKCFWSRDGQKQTNKNE